jgi:hypothetical protein
MAKGILRPIEGSRPKRIQELHFSGVTSAGFSEPDAPPTRATEDVDVVCEVATRVKSHRLGDRLRERGLQEAMGAGVVLRTGRCGLVIG